MLAGLFLATAAGAQTRRIAHRSHSGHVHSTYVWSGSNYGDPVEIHRVKIHLESGRDTIVYAWDSLAMPRYSADTTPRAQFGPRHFKPMRDIRELGMVTGRIIVR